MVFSYYCSCLYTFISSVKQRLKNSWTSALFGVFPTVLQLWEASQKALEPLMICIHRKVQHTKDCFCWTRTVFFLPLLIKSSAGCLCSNLQTFIVLFNYNFFIFLDATLDASKQNFGLPLGVKRGSIVSVGECKSDSENPAVCHGAFCVIS